MAWLTDRRLARGTLMAVGALMIAWGGAQVVWAQGPLNTLQDDPFGLSAEARMCEGNVCYSETDLYVRQGLGMLLGSAGIAVFVYGYLRYHPKRVDEWLPRRDEQALPRAEGITEDQA